MLHRPLALPKSALRRVKVPVALASGTLALALAAAFWNAETFVARSLTVALETGHTDSAHRTDKLVAGSEDFWLSRARGPAPVDGQIEPASWPQVKAQGLNLAVGDRISVNSGGRVHDLEVVALDGVPHGATRIDMATAAPAAETPKAASAPVTVTCRDTAAGADAPLIRFIVDGGDGSATAISTAAHAL